MSSQIVIGYLARRANELGQGVSRSDLRISANGKNDLLRQIEWFQQSSVFFRENENSFVRPL